jgi:mono/diheme cytochrome c family protein
MLQRLLIERIEHRILVGTLSFLGIMVLVGWIAINEGGRMAAFDQQFLARSIERGAHLFNANCSSCHGTDGRGVLGRAPALNSPQLFGHDYLAEYNSQIAILNNERNAEATTPDRIAEIDAQIAELETQRTAAMSQMQAAIDRGYDPESPNRLNNVGWGSTLYDFVYTTLVHGRPTSSSYWPQPMVAWSQTAGGQLRPDQLQDLTNYILNWDRGDDWTVEDLVAVNQFPIEPVDPLNVIAAGGDPVIGSGTEIAAIMEGLAGVTGDPQNGQTLYNGAQYACAGCHMNEVVAPLTEGTWTRTVEIRLQEERFAGYTPEQYLAESIIHPNDYIVPPYASGQMPNNFGDRMTYQQLADLIAYLATMDQPVGS